MIAQATRAIFLASATLAIFVGLVISSLASHGCFV